MTSRSLSELFITSVRWGLRGDPVLWDHMSNYFKNKYFPISEESFLIEVKKCIKLETGVELDSTDTVQAYPRTENGGMSSGFVSLKQWRDFIIPELLDRLRNIR